MKKFVGAFETYARVCFDNFHEKGKSLGYVQ